jgi:hypothetical protein
MSVIIDNSTQSNYYLLLSSLHTKIGYGYVDPTQLPLFLSLVDNNKVGRTHDESVRLLSGPST